VARVAFAALPGWAWVLFGYLLLAVVATWPLALDFGGHIYGPASGDGIGGIAFFDSWMQSILQGHPGRDPFLSYPFGTNLRAALVPPLYFAVELPLTFVLGGAGAYNLLAFLCFPLSAIAAYGLCRVLRFSMPSSAAAGVFYGFTSYHAAHAAGHTTLPHTEFFALVLAALVVWRGRRGLRSSAVASLALTATLTWDYYYAVFVMLMVGAAGIAWLITDTMRHGLTSALVRGLQLVAITLAGVALAMPLFALAKSSVPANALGSRSPSEILIFSVRPCQLLLPWVRHPELGWLGCAPNGVPGAEVGLYVGIVALGLAVVALVSGARRGLPGRISGETWVVVPIAVVGLAWSVPAIWQQTLHFSPPGILWQYISGLRVNSRAVVLVQLAVAVLGAAGLERLTCSSRRHRPLASQPGPRRESWAIPSHLAWLVCGVAAGIFFFESIGISFAASPLPRPAVNEWLASRPRGTVIMQYPGALPGTPTETTGYFYAYYHNRYLLPEIGTNLGPAAEGEDLAVELWVPDPNTAGELRAMGVRYAVSHTGRAYGLRSPDVLRELPGFQTVFSSGGDTAYKVTGVPRPFAYLTGDFQRVEGPSATDYARWMGANGRIGVENPYQHSVPAVLHLDLWCLRDQRSKVVVRGDGVDQHMSDLLGPEDVRVVLPPGRSYIELIPPNPPRRISSVEDRLVTLYVFRPTLSF
jgi:hypothetical protein